MIGGQAHVNQDVPPFMIVSGQPAYVFGLNSVGWHVPVFRRQSAAS